MLLISLLSVIPISIKISKKTTSNTGTLSLQWSTQEDQVIGYGPVDANFNHAGAAYILGEAASNWVGGYGCPSFAVILGQASATKKITRTKNKNSD